MRVHIFGCSGSGKTWLSEKLAAKYNIPHFDLDTIFWDHSQNAYGMKMLAEKRDELLNDILKQENWIIEGVYYSWLSRSFEKADKIIVLDIPKRVYQYRIVKRFLKRKVGIEKGKRESLKSVRALLKWTDQFQSNSFPETLQMIKPYSEKTIVLTSRKAVNNFILRT